MHISTQQSQCNYDPSVPRAKFSGWIDGNGYGFRQDGSPESNSMCNERTRWSGWTDGSGYCHGPFGLGATRLAWYRFPPGPNHCGTNVPGWLSGWTGPGLLQCDGSMNDNGERLLGCGCSKPADGSLLPLVGAATGDRRCLFQQRTGNPATSFGMRSFGTPGQHAMWCPHPSPRCLMWPI